MINMEISDLTKKFDEHQPLEAFELLQLGFRNTNQTFADYRSWEKDKDVALMIELKTKPVTYKMYMRAK
jgi:hypothetical protein